MAAFATSYIPTQASQVTRAADNASMLGDNFATWYNQTQGTFAVGVGRFSSTASTSAAFVTASDNPINNDWIAIYGDVNNTVSNYTNAGVTQAFLNIASPITTGGKVAFAYAANDFAASVQGGAVATDTSGTLTTDITVLRIGAFASNPAPLNGTIRSISYYPTRLSNATLQAITA